MLTITFYVLAFLNINISTAEVFTSLVSMEAILHSERTLSKVLNEYIENETLRLDQLKRLVLRISVSSYHELYNFCDLYFFVFRSIVA